MYRVLLLFFIFQSKTFAMIGVKDNIEVAFFNVGQGNCTVIKAPDQYNLWIIDAGSTQNPQNITNNIFYNRKDLATQISTWIGDFSKYSLHLVLSHPDQDHYNIINNILETTVKFYSANKIKPKVDSNFVFNNVNLYLSQCFDDPKKYGFSKKSNIDTLISKKVFCVIRDLDKITQNEMSVLFLNNPKKIMGDEDEEDEDEEVNKKEGQKNKNHNSLVIRVSYGIWSILLTGDATEKTFESINPNDLKNITILQASHHGAVTDGSNSQGFINLTQPSYVILSAPQYSSYDHPNWNVVYRYVKYLITKKCTSSLYNFFYLNKNIPPLDINLSKNQVFVAEGFFCPILSYQRTLLDKNGCEDDKYYAICLTNCNLFHTGSHGTVIFTLEKSKGTYNTFDYGALGLTLTFKDNFFEYNSTSDRLNSLLTREKTNISIFGLRWFGSSTLNLITDIKEYCKNLQVLDFQSSDINLDHESLNELLSSFKNLSVIPAKKLDLKKEDSDKIDKLISKRFFYMDK